MSSAKWRLGVLWEGKKLLSDFSFSNSKSVLMDYLR